MKDEIKHHRITIIFHWITFTLLLAAFASVLSRELFEGSELRLLLLNLHRSLGILVIVVVPFRLLARFRFLSNAVASHLSILERRTAGIVHALLYALLILVPLLGWLFTSAAGKSFIFFNWILIPPLLAKNRDLAETIGDVHEFCAYLLLTLILIHTAAALWHHFIKKDQIFTAMWPLSKGVTSK